MFGKGEVDTAFAPAAIIVVDDDSVCPGAAFTTIQAAINAAGVGDTIDVCAGTYDEDIVINKDNLSVIGAGAATTNVRGPIGGPGTTVQIAANNVTVAGFTITVWEITDGMERPFESCRHRRSRSVNYRYAGAG